jgi:hypothetical protein
MRWSGIRFDDDVVMLSEKTTKSGKIAGVRAGSWAARILQNRKLDNERPPPEATSLPAAR